MISRFLSLYPFLTRTLANDFSVGSLVRGKHFVQAMPPVSALQYLTGKADKNNKFS